METDFVNSILESFKTQYKGARFYKFQIVAHDVEEAGKRTGFRCVARGERSIVFVRFPRMSSFGERIVVDWSSINESDLVVAHSTSLMPLLLTDNGINARNIHSFFSSLDAHVKIVGQIIPVCNCNYVLINGRPCPECGNLEKNSNIVQESRRFLLFRGLKIAFILTFIETAAFYIIILAGFDYWVPWFTKSLIHTPLGLAVLNLLPLVIFPQIYRILKGDR